ncbi:MAG: hypothetical protein LBQ50_10320 [Planctomycetaceae bacterium]|jgi:hypothetical protein|nr:hypothetical protein [Planctomycetaceae bacterium]
MFLFFKRIVKTILFGPAKFMIRQLVRWTRIRNFLLYQPEIVAEINARIHAQVQPQVQAGIQSQKDQQLYGIFEWHKQELNKLFEWQKRSFIDRLWENGVEAGAKHERLQYEIDELRAILKLHEELEDIETNSVTESEKAA